MIKKFIWAIILWVPMNGFSQNPLFIPDTLSGTNFDLTVQTGTVEFYAGYNTPTYGINGNFLGPTLFLNKDDTVTLNVHNNLPVPTTMHWHGLHVAPEFDGGPHQVIAASTSWSPRFKVMNNASTFWYHPHGHGSTELQVTKGLAGMIIIRDDAEAALNLPRSYGLDDFPIILQTRAFDILYQIAGFTHDDTVVMVNGTIDPFLEVPAQMVRLRLLNGSVDRTYQVGLSNDSSFYQIGTDGGLLEQPVLTNRMQISPGERAEIVINFSGLQGQTVYLMSYASELADGVMGSGNVSMGMATLPGYDANPLNGSDFSLLELNVVAPTASPVTSIPSSLVSLTPLVEGTENTIRNFNLAPQSMGPMQMIEGPFTINGASFDMMAINVTTYLNHTEIWSITNQTGVAHPFHIHDVEFYALDRNGIPVGPSEAGLKDVILVNSMETVRFITKFEDFHNAVIPYMYHCHLLHHEDEGMMGSFVVLDSASLAINQEMDLGLINVYPNPSSDIINLQLTDLNHIGATIKMVNVYGGVVFEKKCISQNEQIDVSDLAKGVYFINIISSNIFTTKKIIIN